MKGRLSTYSMDSNPDILEEDEDIKQVHSETRLELDRYSLPLDIDRSRCAGNNDSQDIVSFEHLERLVPLTLKGSNLQVPDDETVDLTEPRFESFCIVNVKSSS